MALQQWSFHVHPQHAVPQGACPPVTACRPQHANTTSRVPTWVHFIAPRRRQQCCDALLYGVRAPQRSINRARKQGLQGEPLGDVLQESCWQQGKLFDSVHCNEQ